MAPARWEVVGGADKGGILVRSGPEMGSAALPERLATGAHVEELELRGERLNYRRLTGGGPAQGWVSIRLPNKELLVPLAAGPEGPGGSLWDFDDLPELQPPPQPPADPPVGSSWNPRCCEKAAPEAPYTRSLLDFTTDEAGATIPRVIWTLKNVMKLKEWKENVDKVKPGAHWGIVFPHNFELLRDAGASWLTKAFHKAGTLPRDNSVVSLKVHELSTDSMAAESMGGQGMKGWLQVEYEKPHPQLHTDLFVKLPFPYTPQNERAKNSYHGMPDESEIFINRLLGPALPFRIPKYYFGDISYETSNYILISEKLPYKETSWQEGGKDMYIAPFEIEPRIVKFKDYEMPQDGYEQYAAAMRALGRMVAVYHNAGLGNLDLLCHFLSRDRESAAEGLGWAAFMDGFNKAGDAGVLGMLQGVYGSAEDMVVCTSLAFAMTSPLVGGNVMQLLKIQNKEEWGKLKDRWDPVCNDRFLPRNYTCALRTTLLIWKYMDLYGRFQEWKKNNQWWFPPKKPFKCPNFPECLR